MISGTIGKMDKKFTIDCKMYSVKTGEALSTKNPTYDGNISGFLLEIQMMAWKIAEPPSLPEFP